MNGRIAPTRTDKGLTVLAVLLALVFFAAGVAKLIPIEFERSNFVHFGYAMWFMILIGIVELTGATLLLPRRTRALGALLNAAVMVGAATSHLRAGDGIGMAIPALVFLVLLLVVAVFSDAGLRDAVTPRFARTSA